MNEEHLNRYARFLVEVGVGLRRGQQLFIHGGVIHEELARCVEEAAAEAGGGRVHVRLTDPLQVAQLVTAGNRELIRWYHERQRRYHDDVLRTGGGKLYLHGLEFPQFGGELHREHPETFAFFERCRADSYSRFFEEAVHQRRCPWVMAVGVTSVLARHLFPDKTDAEAYAKAAEVVFRCTYCDRHDGAALAAEHCRRLKARQAALDELGVTEVHVTGGGNDFRVGFSRRACWLGPEHTTVSGQRFQINVPCEEVFTTPDRRRTEGRFVASMPFRTTSGVLVKGFTATFCAGRIVDFDAREGKDGFGAWLKTDEGTRYLGEFALVGDDSPVAQSGRFFDVSLLDENAWPHVALGQGFKSGLRGGSSTSRRELLAAGWNESAVHMDVMFGSPEVSVVATKSRRGEVVLVERGRWTPAL